jgi:hypothetical protein
MFLVSTFLGILTHLKKSINVIWSLSIPQASNAAVPKDTRRLRSDHCDQCVLESASRVQTSTF